MDKHDQGVNGYDLNQVSMGRQRIKIYYCADCWWRGDPDTWPLHHKLTTHTLLKIVDVRAYNRALSKMLDRYDGQDHDLFMEPEQFMDDTVGSKAWMRAWVVLVIISLLTIIGLGVWLWVWLRSPLATWLG